MPIRLATNVLDSQFTTKCLIEFTVHNDVNQNFLLEFIVQVILLVRHLDINRSS